MSDKDSLERVFGKIIGSIGSDKDDPSRTKDAVFDNDLLTGYVSKDWNGSWVGMDFSESVSFSKIILYPFSDGNNIELHDSYELFYYGDCGWVSLGKQKATDVELRFDNVPCDALLLLKNHTKGKEERIFTYEDGKQIWW